MKTKQNHKPPKIGEWLLKKIFPGYVRNTAPGDFEEGYNNIYNKAGKLKAQLWYWFQIIKSIPPFLIDSFQWNISMFKNYMLIAFRNLKRNKVYSFINISGLAVGLACCIVVMLFVQDELSYDKFHDNADWIYRVNSEVKHLDDIIYFLGIRNHLAPKMVKEFPEVTNSVRILPFGNVLIKFGDICLKENIVYSDKDVFRLFSFPLIKGDKRTVLKNLHSCVISEKIALKYFKEKGPIGEVITVDGKFDFQITGIMKNIPHNSHLKIDILVSFESLKRLYESETYESIFSLVYLLLEKNTSTGELEKKFPDFIREYFPEEMAMITEYSLQPLKSIHLHSHLGLEKNSDIKYTYILSGVAFIILIIASINFINLSTACASYRTKEVGMRKVVGAKRIQLIRQFLGESVLISFVALLFAIILIFLFLPSFNALSGKQLSLHLAENIQFYLMLAGVTLFVGLLSGGYPAVFISSFQPAEIIKSCYKQSKFISVFFRKGLVVLQFSISLILIIGTILISNQLHYIQNRDLGFNKENVITISISRNSSLANRYEFIKTELLSNSNINSMASSDEVPGASYYFVRDGFYPEGYPENKSIIASQIFIGNDFIKFFRLNIIQGRNFSTEIITDRENAVILNESAVKLIGWTSPIGKEIKVDDVYTKCTVIGVVKDFHLTSFHKEITPTIIRYNPDYARYFFIKIHPDNINKTIAFLEEKWKEYSPDTVFEYSFLEDDIEALYNEEKKTSQVFKFSSLLAIVLGCLGIFGLSTFTAKRRTKEIGIRKVLGATISNIVSLLSKEFLTLIIIANIIAWPVVYFVMKNWLQNFAYKISIGLWMFLTGALLVLFIALITISFQSIKAALANPVDTLRYE